MMHVILILRFKFLFTACLNLCPSIISRPQLKAMVPYFVSFFFVHFDMILSDYERLGNKFQA